MLLSQLYVLQLTQPAIVMRYFCLYYLKQSYMLKVLPKKSWKRSRVQQWTTVKWLLNSFAENFPSFIWTEIFHIKIFFHVF